MTGLPALLFWGDQAMLMAILPPLGPTGVLGAQRFFEGPEPEVWIAGLALAGPVGLLAEGLCSCLFFLASWGSCRRLKMACSAT